MTPFITVVTVCMNRREHLQQSARHVAAWPHHHEHLIVDWSSATPITRDDLPSDPRVRLLRVQGERVWNLARAYNFACDQARGDCLFKLDADCWPEPGLHPHLWLGDGPVCHFGSGPEGRLGQWLLDRTLFERVGGFNELLQGYGFDDKDLKARLMAHAQIHPQPLPLEALAVISHSVLLRSESGVSVDGAGGAWVVERAKALKRTSSLANRVVAAACPWSASRPRSRYHHNREADVWQLDPGTAPQLPDAVGRELLRLRRETFWAELLWLPLPVVRLLPQRLLPAESCNGFQVAVGQRVFWYWQRLTLQPFLALLVRSRGALSGWRRALHQALRHGRAFVQQCLSNGACPLLSTPLAPMLPVWLRQLALEARVDASVKTGQSVEAIWADLLQLLRQYHSHSVLHRLLFRRGYRPQSPADQVALFEAILAEPEVPECLRAYARISLAYRCIKDDNRRLTATLIPELNRQVWALIRDPEALRCQRPNRRNRLKLLISSLTVLNHLQLLGDDPAGLQASGDQICALLQRLDWSLVPADVAYRMLTNTGRCLGLAAIQAWCQCAPQRLLEILSLLDAMQRESWADRHRHSAAQENHRRYIAEMRCRVAGLLVATPSPMAFEPGLMVGELALNVRTPALLERLEALLRGSQP